MTPREGHPEQIRILSTSVTQLSLSAVILGICLGDSHSTLIYSYPRPSNSPVPKPYTAVHVGRVGILSPVMGRGIDSRNRVWN
jgi:hypothetical protein